MRDITQTTSFKVMRQELIVTFNDGKSWSIPVELIALSRANYYKNIDNCSFRYALDETCQVFEKYPEEILDWAQNNMNWEDVKDRARFVGEQKDNSSYNQQWCNAEMSILYS